MELIAQKLNLYLYPGSGVNDDGENDFYFSHIINKGDPLTLSIKNLEILMLKYI